MHLISGRWAALLVRPVGKKPHVISGGALTPHSLGHVDKRGFCRSVDPGQLWLLLGRLGLGKPGPWSLEVETI